MAKLSIFKACALTRLTDNPPTNTITITITHKHANAGKPNDAHFRLNIFPLICRFPDAKPKIGKK